MFPTFLLCVYLYVSTSSLQLKANTEYIVFFFLITTSHAPRENGFTGVRFRVNVFLIYLYWQCPRYLSRDAPFEHFHNIWLNTSAIFLSDAKLTTRVRLITHETSGIRSPLSPRAIYYYTLQRRYIQDIYTILARPTPP